MPQGRCTEISDDNRNIRVYIYLYEVVTIEVRLLSGHLHMLEWVYSRMSSRTIASYIATDSMTYRYSYVANISCYALP